ncbi:MAG: histidine triad nucleotide-binding protein [Acidobacteriota bacterium]
MKSPSDCIFCRIVAGELGTKVHEDDLVVAFDDLNAQAPHHLLIVPREHVASADDLTPDRESLAGRLLTTAARLARDRGLPDAGYRLVINCGAGAGQSVFHLHVHLLGGRTFSWPPG